VNGQRLIEHDSDFFPSERPGTLTREQYLHDWDHVQAMARADGLLPEHDIKWPLTSAVTGLVPAAERVLVGRLTAVLEAVETVAARWRVDAELRAFLNLPPGIAARAMREPTADRVVDYCRFDLAGDHLGGTRIFEVGGDFPGGLSTTGLLNRYWRRTEWVGKTVGSYRPAVIEEPGWQVGALLELARRRGRADVRDHRVGLLVAAELHPLPELDLLREQIRHHSRDALCVPAENPEADGVDVAMLMYPNTPFVQTPERHARLLDRIADGDLVTFNGILGRFIGANKLTLAVLSDPRFRPFFSAEQIEAVDSLVPWSRKVGDGVSVEHARAHRDDVVLKAPFDAISAGVRLGREHGPEEWAELVDAAAREGWLLQEFVPEQSLQTDAGRFHRTLSVAFLAGRPVGHTARLSTSLRATLCPGGGIQAVFGDHVGAGTTP
jgi:hypothetical protein